MGITVKVTKDLDNKLLKEWKHLWSKHPYANIVNSPEWFISAYESYNYTEKAIICVYENSKLIAISGFVKSKLFGIPFFITPAENFAYRQSLLVDFSDEKIVNVFINEIIKLGNVYIKSFTKDIISLLKNYQKDIYIFHGDIYPYVNFLDGEYGVLSKKNKSQIFNRINKLNQKVYAQIREDNHQEFLDIAFKIEQQSYKMQQGKGVLDKEDAQKFYSILGKLLPRNLITSILFFDKKPVAYSIGFIYRNSFSSTQKAHLPLYNYYRPGKLIKIYLMDYWKEKHSGTEFGLGSGYDRFKMDFTKRMYETYIVIFSKSRFISLYISIAFEFHVKVYKIISKNKKAYVIYKKLMNTFS